MAQAKLVPIDLGDGKPRALKLSNLGIIRFEELYGKSVEEVLGEGVTPKLVQALLWASLLWQEPALTFEQASDYVEAYIDASSSEVTFDLMKPLLEALAQSAMYRNRLRKPNGHDADVVPKVETASSSASTPTPTT